jgi:hypothetical protein
VMLLFMFLFAQVELLADSPLLLTRKRSRRINLIIGSALFYFLLFCAHSFTAICIPLHCPVVRSDQFGFRCL